jgi:hypothetical protein
MALEEEPSTADSLTGGLRQGTLRKSSSSGSGKVDVGAGRAAPLSVPPARAREWSIGSRVHGLGILDHARVADDGAGPDEDEDREDLREYDKVDLQHYQGRRKSIRHTFMLAATHAPPAAVPSSDAVSAAMVQQRRATLSAILGLSNSGGGAPSRRLSMAFQHGSLSTESGLMFQSGVSASTFGADSPRRVDSRTSRRPVAPEPVADRESPVPGPETETAGTSTTSVPRLKLVVQGEEPLAAEPRPGGAAAASPARPGPAEGGLPTTERREE